MAEDALCDPCCPASWVMPHETDNYWLRPDGTYDFNPKLIGDAHDWCFGEVRGSLRLGYCAAVSNTFTTWREMERYVKLCKENGYELEVITMTNDYGNIHNVPEATLEKMRARFEPHEAIMAKVKEVMEGEHA
jgi:hypothetical protein